MYIDPPSGWRYGFPKPAPLNIREMTTEQLHQWFAANGYPQKELDYWANSKRGMAYGMFEAEEEEENTHPMSNTNTNTNASASMSMRVADKDFSSTSTPIPKSTDMIRRVESSYADYLKNGHNWDHNETRDIIHGMKMVIEQIIDERDEARRIACSKEAAYNSMMFDNPMWSYPPTIAESKGWDCFKNE